jgi:ketosteroid isomerase-like protein
MKTKLLPLSILLVLISCTTKINLEQEKQNMMQTDIDFSNRSVEVGSQQAFIEYAANDVTLLKPNSYPIVGIDALKQSYIGKSDSSYKLTWKPSYAKIAKSGELGYTYGIWEVEILVGDNKGETAQGTYATVWEKNEKGEWRFVLDTGNDGLKPVSKE